MTSGQRIVQLASEVAAAPTPSAALRRVGALRRELAAFERQQVARALAEGGTFASIARELGLSRQAVHRRFRDLTSTAAPLVTTTDVRRVLLYAREEAFALGEATPHGGHVILATLRAADLPAAAVLRDAGATLERARSVVEATATSPARFRSHPDSGDLRSLLRAAGEAARERDDGRIEVEHLLLGILQEDTGAGARTLRALAVDVGAVREGLAGGIESRLA